MVKKAVAYLRVSSQDQVDLGESLARQEEMILAHARIKGFSDIEVISDKGVSGFKDNRPGFIRLKQLCESGQISAVIVYDLSRLSRSVRTTLSFIEDVIVPRGIDFISLSQQIDTGTPMGKAFLTISSVFNQLYRDEISYKTKAALNHKKAKNEKVGRYLPYGYEADLAGRLIPVPEELGVIKKIKDLRQAGLPYSAIAFRLNREGIRTKTGKGQWYGETVRSLLMKVEK